MNWLTHANAIKRRSEGSQSLARLLIGSMITLYLWLSVWGGTGADTWRAAWYGVIFLGWALALHAHIRLHPEPSVTRRVLAACGDLGATSLAMYSAGAYGAMLYPVYLWVIVGNGLRPDIWKQFKARFGIEEVYEFYAAAEGNVAFVNLLNLDLSKAKLSKAGKAVKASNIKVSLTSTAAKALNSTFGVSLFKARMAIGKVVVVAVPKA